LVILIDCIECGKIIKYNNNIISDRTILDNSFIREFCSEPNGVIDLPAYKKGRNVVNNVVVREYEVTRKLFLRFLIPHQVLCRFLQMFNFQSGNGPVQSGGLSSFYGRFAPHQ
jgi:hypothetical protein